MRDKMHMVLVGDPKVGKSTLINCIMSETFKENVPHIMPVVNIPAEVTLDRISTQIIDTADETREEKENLEKEVLLANVIGLVYSLDSLSSLINIRSNWLPRITEIIKQKNPDGEIPPIILVGCKADVVTGDEKYQTQIEETIQLIMQEYKQVETWLECSAKRVLNVQEVFFYAQKAVMYPQGILFDSKTRSLTAECTEALSRIFLLCDVDGDGVLNDTELNAFQQKCFQSPLQKNELDEIKRFVGNSVEDGVRNNGLTNEGFLYLNYSFIEQNRLETVWSVLRHYGYEDSLSLSPHFLSPDLPHTPTATQIAQLSDIGLRFFDRLFHRFDKDNDNALNPKEIGRLFATSPGIPWSRGLFPAFALTTQSSNSDLTKKGFIALWVLTTLLDYKSTLRYLAYLGFDGNTTTAISISREKQDDIATKKVTRSVFQAFVFGSEGSGKSSLLRGLIQKPNDDLLAENERGGQDRYAINTVDETDRWLVLREFKNAIDTLQDLELMHQCDAAILLHDQTTKGSFNTLIKNFNTLRDTQNNTPIIFVTTKSDLASFDDPQIAKSFFTKQSLFAHHTLNLKGSIPTGFYSSILQTIIKSQTTSKEITKSRSPLWKGILGGLTIATLIGGFVVVWKIWKK